jgi:predicted PurR-regulated permease PerM
MGLYEIVDDLQKKSEQTKKKILIVLVLIFFVLLIALWFTMFKKQIASNPILSPMAEDQGGSTNKGQTAELLGPIESLRDGFGLVIDDIKEKTDEFFSQAENILGESKVGQENRPVYELPNAE